MDIFEMVASAPQPAFVADEEDRILALNPAAEEFLGVVRDEIAGHVFHEVLEPRDVFGNRVCAEGCGLHEMVRRGEPIQAFDLDVRQAPERWARVRISVMVAFGPEPDRYRLAYYLIPRPRRRRTDEAIDLLLKSQGLPEDLTRSRGNGKPDEAKRLTRREMEVLRRLVAGEATREISGALGISPNTLRSHSQRILRKLGAHSRAEAVATAMRQHLV